MWPGLRHGHSRETWRADSASVLLWVLSGNKSVPVQFRFHAHSYRRALYPVLIWVGRGGQGPTEDGQPETQGWGFWE